MSKHSDSDRLIASAAKYLIDGGDNDAAAILLACTIEAIKRGEGGFEEDEPVSVYLRGPRAANDVLNNWNHPLHQSLRGALAAIIPHDTYLASISIRTDIVELDPEWKDELEGIARGKTVNNNQGRHSWRNLHFASVSEMKVAHALDDAGVLFFPNSKARLNGPEGRENRIPDFLVCKEGKWGILEVDGEEWHPASRAVHDHARDRHFQKHGIRVVQHFDATDCFATPKKVVSDFLSVLDQAYR